jgi:RimJ/RimL family protein N-acetyltransferase
VKRPTPVTLQGETVRLEPLSSTHLPDLQVAGDEDPSIFRWIANNPYLIGGWEAWLAEALDGQNAGSYLPWATVERATGRAVGSTRFGDIEPDHGRVEIGWTWLGRSHQRTSLNTEAKLLQLRHAFEELGAERVAFKTDARNVQSQEAIARLGAMLEGTLRRHIRMPDGYIRDSVYYSILRDEWPAVRARLEARLAPGEHARRPTLPD